MSGYIVRCWVTYALHFDLFNGGALRWVLWPVRYYFVGDEMAAQMNGLVRWIYYCRKPRPIPRWARQLYFLINGQIDWLGRPVTRKV